MPGKTATRTSWQNKPLPKKRHRLHFRFSLSQPDFERLKSGLIPWEMEDKWFVFFEEDCLFVHRAWTGCCIYEIRFGARGDRWSADEIWVNRDKNQYKNKNKTFDLDMLRHVLVKLMDVEPGEIEEG